MRARFAVLVLPEPERKSFLKTVRTPVSPEHFARIQAMTEAFPELVALLDERGMSRLRLRRPDREDRHGMSADRGHVPAQEGSASQAQRPRSPWRPLLHRSQAGARIASDAQSRPAVSGVWQRQTASATQVAPAIRVEAHPPVTAPVFAREVCRGNLCGKTFTAPTPPGA
jgi:hypothetical protein